MKAALVIALATPTIAAAEPTPPAELRVTLGGGLGGLDSFDKGGVALGASFDAGWWVSRGVTFGLHTGLAGFQYEHPDGPIMLEWRFTTARAHATLAGRWSRLRVGAGIGPDGIRQTNPGSGGRPSYAIRLGAHVEIGVDIARIGRGTLGAFAIATVQPVPLADSTSGEIRSAIAGVGYTFER